MDLRGRVRTVATSKHRGESETDRDSMGRKEKGMEARRRREMVWARHEAALKDQFRKWEEKNKMSRLVHSSPRVQIAKLVLFHPVLSLLFLLASRKPHHSTQEKSAGSQLCFWPSSHPTLSEYIRDAQSHPIPPPDLFVPSSCPFSILSLDTLQRSVRRAPRKRKKDVIDHLDAHTRLQRSLIMLWLGRTGRVQMS